MQMRSLTISELEQATGFSRSTIYYYVREGLLPPAQKAAASRALYSEAHLEILKDIARLKEQGLGLQAIKAVLADKIISARELEVDLVAQQVEQTRQAILAAAARLFASKGYKRTRIADIVKEVGVTPPVFYSHFHSKQELFVEAFGVFVSWMHDFVEGLLATESDPVARDLNRAHAFIGIQALSPDLLGLVRSEALHENGDMRAVVERSYFDMVQGTQQDLVALREKSGAVLPVADELVAFGLLGSLENIVMRASWDDRYSIRDVLQATLSIFLAVWSVYSGHLDLRSAFEQYLPLVKELSVTSPRIPPPAVR